ncbi:hypothetical protein [Rhizomonospora bruguierae]|uniref:hypothetical protein n=1 Tax=Rhizomonospora bruguierae TaxID=1581705 RepID=UPI001BCDED3F|nr:hypothetical protein [Micromonospora sp. NBRC 107566]
MSEYVEFFGAPNDKKAKAVHGQGPKRRTRTVSGSFFEADDAIVTWENLLTGRLRKHAATIDDPRMVADMVNDGSAVFALSDELVARLIQADLPRLRDVAEAWRAELLRNGEDIDADAALGILVGVAGLAREAVQSDGGVYCWVTG